MVEFCLGFGVLFLLLAVHPYVTYPLSLMLLPRRPVAPKSHLWPRPTVAICMSAFNEERVIVDKVESLLAMAKAYGPAEIHIYVDGAADRTAELLEPYADRVRLIVSEQRRGKTAGLKRLLDGLQTELFAFTDANVQVPSNSLAQLIDAFQDPEVCCASARLVYSNKSESGVSTAGAAYWSIEEYIKGLETERVSLVGVDGALFVIERSAYFTPTDDLIDDLYVSIKALMTGRRVVSLPLVQVEERNANRWDEEFRRKARISCQAMRVHRALWPELRKTRPLILYCYLSHRLLKWLTPFTLALAGLMFFGVLATLIGWAFALALTVAGAALLLLGAGLNLPYFRAAATALIALAGVAWGQIQALLTNQTYATWTPAASVRD